MWNLNHIRERLKDRLAEESTVFWSASERDDAINDAQRFISAATHGVPLTVTEHVSEMQPYVPIAGHKLLGEYATAGWMAGNTLRALQGVSIQIANVLYPGWPQARGKPRWSIVAPDELRVYISPVPADPVAVSVKVSVLPADLALDSDVVFAGEQVMEKYQGPLLNLAVAYCLLKERYDGDAERFYAIAMQELSALGVDPARLPNKPQEAPSE